MYMTACGKVEMLLMIWTRTININEWEVGTELLQEGNDDGMNMINGGR